MTMMRMFATATTRTAAAPRETPTGTRGTRPFEEEVVPTSLSYVDDEHDPYTGAKRVGGLASTTRPNDDDTVIVDPTCDAPLGYSSVDVVARAQLEQDPVVVAAEVGADQTQEFFERRQGQSETSGRHLVRIGLCIVLSLAAVVVGTVTYLVFRSQSGDENSSSTVDFLRFSVSELMKVFYHLTCWEHTVAFAGLLLAHRPSLSCVQPDFVGLVDKLRAAW